MLSFFKIVRNQLLCLPIRRQRFKSAVILGLLCLSGFVVRVLYLGQDSYWFDEANSIIFCYWKGPILKHYYAVRLVYFVFLKIWVALFGNSEFLTRLFSVIIGTISIGVLYKLSRLFFDRKRALFSSFILAFSFFHSLWSRNVMNYVLFCFFSIAVSYCFLKYIKSQKKKYVCWYVFLALMFIFTHPFAVFLVLIQNFIFLYFREKINLRCVYKYQIIIFLALMVLGYLMVMHSPDKQIYETTRFSTPSLKIKILWSFIELWKVWESFTFGGRKTGHGGVGFDVPGEALSGGYILLVIYSILFLTGINKIVRAYKENNSFRKIYLLYIMSSLFIPIGMVFFINFWKAPLICERYFIFNYFAWIITITIGFFECAILRRIRYVIIGIIFFLSLTYLQNLYIPRYYQTWRDISGLVKINIQRTDAIVLIPFGNITPFWFYYKDGSGNDLEYITKDGVYIDGKWQYSFKDGENIVIGSEFKKIEEFIGKEYFKKFSLKNANIWLVMSPYWEELDDDARKVYKSLNEYYERVLFKEFVYNGIFVEKWVIKN